MRKRNYFIEGDILKWLNIIPKAKKLVKAYRYWWDNDIRNDYVDEYKEATYIINLNTTFMASLSVDEKELIASYYKHGGYVEQGRILLNKNIIENWNFVVLSNDRFKVKELNNKNFSEFIKSKREYAGLNRAEAARYLGISSSTLKSYEDGYRSMPINIWFKMCQLYEINNYNNVL